MSFEGTTCLLKNFVIFETLFGVNRLFLVTDRTNKILCYMLFTISFMIIFGSLINDYVILDLDMSFSNKCVQIFNGIELIVLAAGAIMKKTFVAQDRLDLKCGLDDNYLTKFKALIKNTLIVNVASVVINIGASLYIEPKVSVALTYSYAAAVHDMEMDLIRLFIEGYNLRLTNLKEVSPSIGCRVYRHVLINASQLDEEYNFRVSIVNYVRDSRLFIVANKNNNSDLNHFVKKNS